MMTVGRITEKTEDYQNCSVLCCVRQLCTYIWAVFTAGCRFICLHYAKSCG